MKDFKKRKEILLVQTIIFAVGLFVSFTYTATAQALLQAGMEAPKFSLNNIEGKEISLSQYSGKKATVILFWASWSANSSKALKRFEGFYEKYKDRGIQVIGINADKQLISDKDRETIKRVVKELGVTFPVLIDRGLKTFHSYSVIALPSTVIISGGRISYELPGLPLVGTEDMFDYLLVLAGKAPRKKLKPKYLPRYDAVADANLAGQFVKKKIYIMSYSLFKKAIEKDPKYMLPRIGLAKLYEMEDKKAEAEETLRKALTVEPENVVAMSELGYLLSKTGKTKEAIEILRRAVKKDSYTPVYYYLAYALSKEGRLKEALNAFGKALSLNPYDPAIYELRAEVYEKNKMLKEAAADYRKALELRLKVQ